MIRDGKELSSLKEVAPIIEPLPLSPLDSKDTESVTSSVGWGQDIELTESDIITIPDLDFTDDQLKTIMDTKFLEVMPVDSNMMNSPFKGSISRDWGVMKDCDIVITGTPSKPLFHIMNCDNENLVTLFKMRDGEDFREYWKGLQALGGEGAREKVRTAKNLFTVFDDELYREQCKMPHLLMKLMEDGKYDSEEYIKMRNADSAIKILRLQTYLVKTILETSKYQLDWIIRSYHKE